MTISTADSRTAPPAETLTWAEWLSEHFPHVCFHPFSERHLSLWEWFASLTPEVRPRPRVEVWPRGGGKSTSVELGVAYVGIKLTRRFVLYVSETQEQADLHVQSVATHFEHQGVKRALNIYGHSKGWKRSQLRTASGFNVAAYGLDAAARGIKLDNYRPDWIVFDDVDGREDSAATIVKKVNAITNTLLPAGSTDCAILFVQNKVHKDSIISTLTDGRADFLLDREVPTVEPAVVDLAFEKGEREDGSPCYKITGGTPTWAGQDLAVCEQQINAWGWRAFLREAQHRVETDEDGLWQRARDIEPYRVVVAPTLTRVAVAIDPSSTSGGDEAGIIVGGLAYEYAGQKTKVPHAYIIEDASLQGSPHAWAHQAVSVHHKHYASVPILAEDNNGGEMVELTIKTIEKAPSVKRIHASRGKVTRAEPVQKLYEDGRVHHVGTFGQLEQEMCSWQPGDPSPNRMDALVWLLTELLVKAGWWTDPELQQFMQERQQGPVETGAETPEAQLQRKGWWHPQ